MEIIALAENQTTETPGLVGEHGLALLVMAHGKRVLFDTGATGALVANAKALGLDRELGRVDAIVISHGHYDHAGGLLSVLEYSRRPIPVHVGHGFFRPRLSLRTAPPRAIGVPFEKGILEAHGAQLIHDSDPRGIFPGFWLTREIPLREESEAGEPDLMLGSARTHAAHDPFTDELALAVEGNRGLAVLVGCSHRGMLNAIVAARSAAGGQPAHVVVGGAHLRAASDERIAWATQRALALTSEVALGHCTGEKAEASFAQAFGERFHRLRTGWRWTEEALS
jgi:7,8-dihydropterin-6-yl-methyl-4-(beta-D-ribofuranosyl)aminobenzene 5'-phosphate synthase